MKCQACKQQFATMTWQPFGPDPTGLTFTTFGNHYRGFPVVKICDTCKYNICEQDHMINFRYRGVYYTYDKGEALPLKAQ
jgi:hypothetical protein